VADQYKKNLFRMEVILVGPVVLTWYFEIDSFQGLMFDFPWVSPYKAALNAPNNFCIFFKKFPMSFAMKTYQKIVTVDCS
jgi:hypothetical protein